MAKHSGSELRDTVYNLLRLQFSVVEVEFKVANKTADIFYVDDTNLLFQTSIGIECKDWSNPLNSTDLRSIYQEYFPALQSGEIERLVIIGRHEIGRDPSETVRQLDKTSYVSFDQFITSMMNFSYLLQDNILAFRNHEAAHNYLTSYVVNEADSVEKRVRDWLKKDEGVLLVYGGYGVGKTTFSHYITSLLSQEYKRSDFDRIPIRISLGDLYYKQDLKSLIASALSGADGTAGVRNFSYHLFLEMARLGYFLLILDGFDEMRHAMDVADFEYTFAEMSSLFVGNSKTIILGRPDSFFTDEEEDRIIDAIMGKKARHSKLEMSMLTKEQVSKYIDNYISSYEGKASLDELLDLKEKVVQAEFDVISRPVQLKMFTSIMDRLVGNEVVFNRYELYFNFIYNFARREDQKVSRRFSTSRDWKYGYSDPRTVFMQSIAWWILTRKKENRFFPKEIPTEYIPEDLRQKVDKDAALREIILGSVIEPEQRSSSSAIQVEGFRHYYFPHKSYIEFLVAEYFCRAQFSREMYAEFFEVANSEVLSFVQEGPADATSNFRQGLEFARGTISSRVLEIAARDPALQNEKLSLMNGKGASGRLYVFYQWLKAGGGVEEEIESFLFSALVNANSLSRCAAAYAMIAEYLGRVRSPDLCAKILVFCFERIGTFNFRKLLEFSEGAVLYSTDAVAMHMSLFVEAIDLGRGKVTLKLKEAKAIAKEISKSQLYVAGFDSPPVESCRSYTFDMKLFDPIGRELKNLLLIYIAGETRRGNLDIKVSYDTTLSG